MVRFSLLLLTLLTAASALADAAEQGFPYDRELMLDAPAMPGSKRIPGLEVAGNGQATIYLWCATVRGQFVVAGDTVTVITGPRGQEPCAPDRVQADDALLADLQAVTTWRRDGDGVTLEGPHPLRYRPMTN